MPIDILGLFLISISFIATVTCFFSSAALFKKVPYKSHQYFTVTSAFGAFWILSYFPTALLTEPVFLNLVILVHNIGFIMATGFAVGLIFWITTAYYHKGLGTLRTIAVFMSGAFCFTAIFPGSWSLVQSAYGWQVVWTPFLSVVYLGLVLVSTVIVINYCWQIILAIRRSKSRLYHATAPILLISLLLLVLSAGLIAIVRSNPFLEQNIFLIPLAIAIWTIAMVTFRNPTVHVITAPRIHYFFVLDLRRSVPLFTYSFSGLQDESNLELLTAILGAVRSVLGEISTSMRKMSSIITPYGQCLVEELGPIGTFLLTDGEVPATRQSLKYCTKAFATQFQYSTHDATPETHQYLEFEKTVRHYFDFAF